MIEPLYPDAAEMMLEQYATQPEIAKEIQVTFVIPIQINFISSIGTIYSLFVCVVFVVCLCPSFFLCTFLFYFFLSISIYPISSICALAIPITIIFSLAPKQLCSILICALSYTLPSMMYTIIYSI